MLVINTEGKRGRERRRWLDGIADSGDMNLGKLVGDGEGRGGLACCSGMGRLRVSCYDLAAGTTQQQPSLFSVPRPNTATLGTELGIRYEQERVSC